MFVISNLRGMPHYLSTGGLALFLKKMLTLTFV